MTPNLGHWNMLEICEYHLKQEGSSILPDHTDLMIDWFSFLSLLCYMLGLCLCIGLETACVTSDTS